MQEMACPGFKFQIFSGRVCPYTRGVWPLLSPSISNDKLWLIFFNFLCFFPSFISNTSVVSISFRGNLETEKEENCISGLQISKMFWGSIPPDPLGIHAWYVGHMAIPH